jgi:hypothetical protein
MGMRQVTPETNWRHAWWQLLASQKIAIRHLIAASADRHFNWGMAWKIDS